MASVSLSVVFALAAVLFVLGLAGVLMRRNIIFILLSVEIMLNACGLAFIAAGRHLRQADGQVMYFFILAMAAVEMALGLGLVLNMRRTINTLDTNQLNRMREDHV
jgi:NADH-quinone oxidoreductase subunit K